jgi:hypothetical protein
MKMLKFGLNTGTNLLQVPGGLSVDSTVQHQPAQPHSLQLWTLVDDKLPPVQAEIYVARTGEDLDPNKNYINLGTCQLHGGGTVLHALFIQE